MAKQINLNWNWNYSCGDAHVIFRFGPFHLTTRISRNSNRKCWLNGKRTWIKNIFLWLVCGELAESVNNFRRFNNKLLSGCWKISQAGELVFKFLKVFVDASYFVYRCILTLFPLQFSWFFFCGLHRDTGKATAECFSHASFGNQQKYL